MLGQGKCRRRGDRESLHLDATPATGSFTEGAFQLTLGYTELALGERVRDKVFQVGGVTAEGGGEGASPVLEGEELKTGCAVWTRRAPSTSWEVLNDPQQEVGQAGRDRADMEGAGPQRQGSNLKP